MLGKLTRVARHHVEVSLDRVAEIVVLARQCRSDARSSPDESGAASEAERTMHQHGEQQAMHDLRVAISALSEDEQAVLIALAWIGRGDFSSREFDEALTRAFDRCDGPPADYLISLPKLDEALQQAVTACGAEPGGHIPPPAQSKAALH